MKLPLVLSTTMTLIALIYCNDSETEEDKIERIESIYEYVIYDIVDFYDEITKVYKDVLLEKSLFSEKTSKEVEYAAYLRKQLKQLQHYSDDVPLKFIETDKMLHKINNAALEEEDYEKLIAFGNSRENASKTKSVSDPSDESDMINKQTYLDLLATSRNISYLQEIWSNWQEENPFENDYVEILHLTEKAASLNGDYDAKTYWEDMVQYENSYETATTIWNEIEPFYQKFHKFVLDRINHYYQVNFTHVPVYLTGSNFGDDWSNIADIVVPHQQIYQDAKISLNAMSTREIYEHCNKVSEDLKFKKNHEKFWSESVFDSHLCAPEVLSFCSAEYSILFTCKNISWAGYLDAQESTINIGLKNLDYSSLPLRSLRESFMEHAIETVGVTVAIHDLAQAGFIEEEAFTNHVNATENRLTARLLLALRLLPKLAYYFSADTWRLNELQYPSHNLTSSWWQTRRKYQSVEGITNEELDFLEDEYITRNRPYLAKFLGTIFHFQYFSQLELFPEDGTSTAKGIAEMDFAEMLAELTLKNPKDLIDYHYSSEHVNAYNLLQYFGPLEEYFENAPLEPLPFEVRNIKDLQRARTIIEETTTVRTVAKETPVQVSKLAEEEKELMDDAKKDKKEEPSVEKSQLSVGMYVLITVGACAFILIVLVVFKRVVKMKKPRTNNRRFEA